MRPIALSTHGGATGVPKGTKLRLNGQRLESTARRSDVGPGPLHPHSIVLTRKSLEKVRNHGHTGEWTLTGGYQTIIMVAPDTPTDQSSPKGMPEVPGLVMQRPLWTTFTHELVIDYYDGPRAFLKMDANGQQYLVLWNDDTPWAQRWLHIPLSPQELQRVLAGAATVLETIHSRDFVFFVDEANNGAAIRTVMTLPAALSPNQPIAEGLPSPGITMKYKQDTLEEWEQLIQE